MGDFISAALPFGSTAAQLALRERPNLVSWRLFLIPRLFLYPQRSRCFPFARLLAQGALCAALALALTSAWAEGGGGEAPGVAAGSLLQVVLGLLLILALLFLAAYGLRRLNGGQGLGGGPLKIVGGLIMGTRERIVLIEVGDTWLLIGVAPGQIRTLHRMPKGEVPQLSLGEKPFGHWLKQMLERDRAQK